MIASIVVLTLPSYVLSSCHHDCFNRGADFAFVYLAFVYLDFVYLAFVYLAFVYLVFVPP